MAQVEATVYILFLFHRSTDSELKLWNTESGQCLRTFKGHINEKNFVGLSVSCDFIACGELLLIVLCSAC